jgi:GT2 family glycosyltransferase
MERVAGVCGNGAAFSLGGDVTMLILGRDGAVGRPPAVTVDGRALATPAYVGEFPCSEGAGLLVVVVRLPPSPPPREVALAADGGTPVSRPFPASRPSAELVGWLRALSSAARARLLRQMIDTVGPWFSLAKHAPYQELVASLIAAGHQPDGQILAHVPLAGRLTCVRGRGIEAGAVRQVVILGAGSYRRSTSLPRGTGDGCFELVLDGCLPSERPALLFFFDAGSRLCPVPPAAERTPSWLIEHIARHSATASTLAGALLAAAKPYLGGADAAELRRIISLVAAATPRLPSRFVANHLDLALGAAVIAPIPGGGILACGWVSDPRDLIAELMVLSPFGQRLPLSAMQRPAQSEMIQEFASQLPASLAPACQALVAAAAGPDLPGGDYQLVARLRTGGEVTVSAPPGPTDAGALRDRILRLLPATLPVEAVESLLDSVLAKPIAALHRAHLQGDRVRQAYSIGQRPAAPIWSIIVPLYRNLAFLRTQYARLALDPRSAEMELIYVLDSPDQEAALRIELQGLVLTYGLAVTIIVHHRNLGYAPATNSGAGYARGRTLVLMNSDVVPLTADWLGALAAGREALKVAAAGPKLLFDDDSLQHAGLYFGQYVDGRWINRHYFKGYPRQFAEACVSRRVPAVTGACLMVDRPLFEQVGGLSEDYIIGDYEDSDFCLKLWSRGAGCGYVAEAELYHFERRSISDHRGYDEGAAVHYNRWLHHQRWQDAIATIGDASGPGQDMTPIAAITALPPPLPLPAGAPA